MEAIGFSLLSLIDSTALSVNQYGCQGDEMMADVIAYFLVVHLPSVFEGNNSCDDNTHGGC